jgi:hypothetical protein
VLDDGGRFYPETNVSIEQEIAAFLDRQGLGALPTPQRRADESDYSVWASRFDNDDREVQIFVFLLSSRPQGVVMFEEMQSTLEDGKDNPTLPLMLAHERTPGTAFIAICDRRDEELLRTYKTRSRPGDWKTRLAYDPLSDRIVGGDYFHEMKGRWLKAMVLPLTRAKDVAEMAQELGERLPSPASGPPAFPLTLAVLTMPQLPVEDDDGEPRMVAAEEVFERTILRVAPPEFRELGLMQSVVSMPHTIANRPPDSEAALIAMAGRLMEWLRVAHQNGFTFTSKRGSSLWSSTIATDGSATDCYYVSREMNPYLRTADIGTAILTCIEAGSAVPSATGSAIEEAARVYTGARLPDRVATTARALGDGARQRSSLSIDPMLDALVKWMAGAVAIRS